MSESNGGFAKLVTTSTADHGPRLLRALTFPTLKGRAPASPASPGEMIFQPARLNFLKSFGAFFKK